MKKSVLFLAVMILAFSIAAGCSNDGGNNQPVNGEIQQNQNNESPDATTTPDVTNDANAQTDDQQGTDVQTDDKQDTNVQADTPSTGDADVQADVPAPSDQPQVDVKEDSK